MRACVRACVCVLLCPRHCEGEEPSAGKLVGVNSAECEGSPSAVLCRLQSSLDLTISRPDSSVFTDFSEDFTHERILIRGAKAMREVAAVLQWSRAERQMITGLQ